MAYKTAKQLEEERVRALANQWQKANSGTKLNSTQQETLKRMISVNNSSAQQELRRADYYNGGSQKYDVSKVDYKVRNDFTNRTRTASKEVFSLKDGYSEPTMEGRYSGSDDSFSKSRLGGNRLQKAVNSVKNPMSTTSNNSSSSSSTREEKKPGFWSDVKDTFQTIGQVVNPFDDVKAGDAIDNFVKNGFKNTDTKEINRLANRTLDASTFNSASAVMKATRGDQSVDWQGNRKFGEGGGADMAADLAGYLVPGIGVATGLRGTKAAANLAGRTTAGKAAQIAKEGAITGGIIAAAETPAKEYVNPETTAAQHAARIGLETAAGVVLDPVVHGLGSLMGKAANKAISKFAPSSTTSTQPQQATTATQAVTPAERPAFGQSGTVAARKNNAPAMPQQATQATQAAPVEPMQVNPVEAPRMTAREIDEEIQNIESQMAFSRIMGGDGRPELEERLASLRQESAAAKERQQTALSNLPFGHMGSNTPAARKPSMQEAVENTANDVLFQRRPQQEWRQRYEDFTNYVNGRYDRSATTQNRKEFEQAVEQQYQYLKDSMGKGVEPGGIIRDNTGEVVSRYGRISNNPTWYQEFYAAYGRKPTNAELRQLAEQHVRNGYSENGVDIPSWSPKSVKDIDAQIDEIRAIGEMDAEEGAALQPVLKALEQERSAKLEDFYKTAEGLNANDLEMLWRGFAQNGEDVSLQELITLAHAGEKGGTPISKVQKQTRFDSEWEPTARKEFEPATGKGAKKAREFAAKNAPELLDPSLKTLMKRDPKLNAAIKALFRNEKTAINTEKSPQVQMEQKGPALLDEPVKVTGDTKQENSLPNVPKEEMTQLKKAVKTVKRSKGSEKKPSKAKKLPEGIRAMRSAGTVASQQNILPSLQTDNKTITHQQLLNSIRKNTGVTLRTGRLGVGDDAVKGIYKESPEVVRTREYGDLETISHEIGHDFSKKYNLTDPQFDNELMRLGQATSGPGYSADDVRQEGIAEFMRRYLVNPQLAQQDAPQFFQHFQNVIPAKVLKGLGKVQEDVTAWLNQPADMRMRGRIHSEAAPKGITKLKQALEKLPQTKEEFYTETVDRLFPISKAEKEILGGKLADATESAYKRARLAAGTPRIADQKLQELAPVFKELRENGYEMQDLSDYLTAKHAADLEAQGIQSGFKADEIAATLKKYDNPAMQDMQQKVVSYNNSLLDMLVDSGVLSKDSVDAMRAKHPNYVPFFRHFDEEAGAGLGSGKGFVDLTNPVKRMKGSSRNVINPLESMIKNTFSVVQAAEKNKVGLNLAKLAEKPGAGKWIERLDGKESVRNENIVTVFENGEKVQYQLAPELYKSVKALDKEITNKAVLLVGKATDWLRAGATLTPEFMLRNPIRDQFNATIVSDVGYNPIDFFRGLKEIGKVKNGKGSAVYDDWVKQGGAYGGYLSADRNILQENLSGLSEQGKSPLQRAIDTLKSPSQWGRKTLETLQKASEISEEATKVGAYKKGLKKGLTPSESAYQARELMDFNRMGNTMQAANRIYAFLNANVQGKDKLIRAFKENPVRTTGRILGTTLPPTAVAAMSETWANEKQKEIMDNMPQWEKETYWAFAVPGTDLVTRIPKPFDINAVPNAVEKGMDYLQGDPYAFENKEDTDIWKIAATALSPTLVKPLAENMANHSFFTGGPIVPQRDQDYSPKEQYGPTTSATAKGIANVLDKIGIDALKVSPYAIDNAYKGYTAGLGQYPLKGLDKVISMLTGDSGATPVGKSFTESAPGIRAFFTNDMNGGQVIDDYYRIMEEQTAIKKDAEKHNQDPPNAAEMKEFGKIGRELSKLRREYNEVMASTEMSPEEKRAEVDRLNKAMKEMARQGILIFRPDYQ